MSKPTNPRRRPATQADVERAKRQAMAFATEAAMAIFFTALCDKESKDVETMQRVWREVNSLSESVSQGYVNIADLRDMLKREYDIEIRS